MIVTIKNGKAELRKDSGSFIRYIGSSHVISAAVDENEEYVLVVYENGKAEMRKSTGSLLRVLVTKGAVGGDISSERLTLQLDNGKTQIRKVPSGSLISTR